MELLAFGVRDHRKMLICDDHVAFIGGFNISDEYDGDGVTCGLVRRARKSKILCSSKNWRCRSTNYFRWPIFIADHSCDCARSKRRRKGIRKKAVEELLLTNPGRGKSPFQIALHNDFAQGQRKSKSSAPIFCRRGNCGAICAGRPNAARASVWFSPANPTCRSLNSPRSIIIAVC